MNEEEAIEIKKLLIKRKPSEVLLKEFAEDLPNETVLLNGYASETYLSDTIFGDEYLYKYETRLLVINNNFSLLKENIEPYNKERKEIFIIGEKIDLEFLYKYFNKILIKGTDYSFIKHLYNLGYSDFLKKSFERNLFAKNITIE